MAIRDHIDADFNAPSRQVECKVEIYFDAEPLVITHSDYLMKLSLTEESSAESSNPLGAVSANELDLTLSNKNRIFTPTNVTGPYYGKIKNGVKLKVFFRLIDPVDTLNWIEFGVYYVAEWNSEATGINATVYATDIMSTVLTEPSANIQVVAGYTFKQFYDYMFATIGHAAVVSSELDGIIPFAYASDSISADLSELTCAAMAMCYSDRAGVITVEPINASRALRATLTDSDQVVSVTVKQSTIKTYDGVSLTYRYPQLLLNQNLLEVTDLDIPAGNYAHDTMYFDDGPVAAVGHVAVQTLSDLVTVLGFSYTPWQIKLITNSLNALTTNLSVYGTLVDFTDTVISDEAASMFSYTNKYIQTVAYASVYKAFLEAFVGSDVPTIDAKIRGNLLLKPGDKITVTSDMFNVTFTGVIKRMKYTYEGYLSCTATLLNSDIVEVIA